MYSYAALGAALLSVARAQQVGTLVAEVHPKLPIQKCTTAGGCVTQNTSIVLDSNWRWLHTTSGSTNCYTGNSFDTTICSSGAACAAACALDGANYASTYGITTSGNALTLKFVTGANVGSRVYLVSTDDVKYEMFKLKNQEFTFDVDMANLPCGLNGALYFVDMDADGGLSKYPGNKAGSKYGTGYCDGQCPHDIKFMNGEANVEGWNPIPGDANSGRGKYGTCCDEMDIWEANSVATAYTPHPCTTTGPYRCSGTECGDGAERYSGVCDKDGCDFNSWRMGNREFLGPGKTVDTTKKITVITQFITTTGTAAGDLKEIRRIYQQNGVTIANSVSTAAGVPSQGHLDDAFCAAQKTAFGDNNQFGALGGMKAMGDAYTDGMVLAMSLWDDGTARMLWLDSEYPLEKDGSEPGVSRGPCARTSGVPADVRAASPGASVTYSNIKVGDIGSTFTGGVPVSSSSRAASSSSTRAASSSTRTTSSTAPVTTGAPHWGQCGGTGWTGPTTCVSPWTCVVSNPWYSQCL